MSNKITLTGVGLSVLSLMVFLTTLLLQRGVLHRKMEALVHAQGVAEAAKAVETMLLNCEGVERRNQRQLSHALAVARDTLSKAGTVSWSSETTEWQAINQFTRQTEKVVVPKLFVGGKWLEPIRSTTDRAMIVDDVKYFTGDFCTVFQRMNENGDMLRVCTSVLNTNGTRAIGTYIPAVNPDGNPNPVVQAVLRGETFRGRAFVVNEYHAAAYEPIWDDKKTRVMGMLYVGIGMGTINKELNEAIGKLAVGKQGYMVVLGGKGDSKGKFLVSKKGEFDGQSAWDAKDAAGKPFISALIEKALGTDEGKTVNQFYKIAEPGEKEAKNRFAVAAYFAPWDWVLTATGYEDDFNPVLVQVASSINSVVKWTAIAGVMVVIVGLLLSQYLSNGISRPVMKIVDHLNEGTHQNAAAAAQVNSASNTLADGANRQAAVLEETSSSLEALADMTRKNTVNAQKSRQLTKEARTAAEKGARDMESMTAAMRDIKGSSDDIAKIIKTIDEIAFQTNILALNAAVEAARAGEAGLGFAVVADEVRNLARRSAQSAKEITEIIQGAIKHTTLGVSISNTVADELNVIVEKIRQVDSLVTEVTTASTEQAHGIAEINTAVASMDKVTQESAATAQETAAAAVELNAQTEAVRQSVMKLLRVVNGGDCEDLDATNHPSSGRGLSDSVGDAEFAGRSVLNGFRSGKRGPSIHVNF